MDPRTFSLDDLCTLSGFPKRTVRYYIQIGLLPRPEGEKRGAYYLSAHLDALLRIRQLSEAGVSLERIRDVLAGEPPVVPPRPRVAGAVEVRSHIHIAPGLELEVAPDQAQVSPEQLRAFTKAVLVAWQRIKEGKHEK